MAKKRRTAKQKAATAKLVAYNKRHAKKSPKRKSAKRGTSRKKISHKALHILAKETNKVPLDVLMRRAKVSAETLVREARKAGITDLSEIPEYVPKGRRRR